jgi:hypothetical protein
VIALLDSSAIRDLAIILPNTSFELFPAALICGCLVLTTLATVWATLGQGFALVRVIIAIAAAIGSVSWLQKASLAWHAAYGTWPTMDLLRVAMQMGRDQMWPVCLP